MVSGEDVQASIEVTVTPRSSRSIIRAEGGTVKVYIKSPPVDGRANQECIELFSKALRVPKSRISIDRGLSGRKKRLLIQGMTREQVFNIIEADSSG